MLVLDTYTRTLSVRRADIVSKGDRSENCIIIIIIIIIIVVVGGGGGRSQSEYDSLRSVPLLIPTPVDARCFDHSQYSHVKAIRYFNVWRRRHGALLCSVSTAVQTVDLPEPNRNLRHFDSVQRPF